MPSREMAWRRRGAPVRLCSPAPHVEKKEPMTMTQGDGQASVPTTRFPLTASPNLRGIGVTQGRGRQTARPTATPAQGLDPLCPGSLARTGRGRKQRWTVQQTPHCPPPGPQAAELPLAPAQGN